MIRETHLRNIDTAIETALTGIRNTGIVDIHESTTSFVALAISELTTAISGIGDNRCVCNCSATFLRTSFTVSLRHVMSINFRQVAPERVDVIFPTTMFCSALRGLWTEMRWRFRSGFGEGIRHTLPSTVATNPLDVYLCSPNLDVARVCGAIRFDITLEYFVVPRYIGTPPAAVPAAAVQAVPSMFNATVIEQLGQYSALQPESWPPAIDDPAFVDAVRYVVGDPTLVPTPGGLTRDTVRDALTIMREALSEPLSSRAIANIAGIARADFG